MLRCAVRALTAPGTVRGSFEDVDRWTVEAYSQAKMPRGFHPCFAAQSWLPDNKAILTFASDGSVYEYTAVPADIWDAYHTGTLDGDAFNAGVRATIGPYVRIS